MRKGLLFFVAPLLLCSKYSSSQTADSMICKGTPQFEVTAFISDHQYQGFFDKDFFKNDFTLALSDTTFTIAGFRISWTDNKSIFAAPIRGNKVPVIEKNYSLNKLDTGLYVAFDCITIQKNNSYYKVPSFIVNTTTANRAELIRKDIPVCYTYIAGYRNNNSASHTIFRSDLLLQLTDSSYKIIDFEITWDDGESDLQSAKFHGNKILVNRDLITSSLKRLIPGSTVTIENIRVEKNGKIYKAKDMVMYLK